MINKKTKQYILHNSFYCFFLEIFRILNPGKELKTNWHLEYLSLKLEEIYEGKYKNVIINVPPRSLKSTMVNVAWNAWIMGKKPSTRIISCSFADKLSYKHSIDCRNVLQSSWFKENFPKFKFSNDQNCKNKYETTEHGFRMASSVGSSIIGEGGDILICDDPISPLHVNSKKMRDKVYDWYMDSFSTRLNDKKNGIKIIVMQRLHEDDLCGRILKNMPNLWNIINIPAIADENLLFKTQYFKKIFYKNEILHSDHEGQQELQIMKEQLGSKVFAAQYLQKPIKEDGEFIKNKWINRYINSPHEYNYVVQSWDLAFTKESYSDYSVCTTWGIENDNYYLCDVYREKRDFNALIKDFISLYKKYNVHYAIIEDTVASKSFIQHIKANVKANVVTIRPKTDKLTRLIMTLPILEMGRVFFPQKADWLIDLESELFNFPQVDHDDQVDSITQFLLQIESISKKKNQKMILRLD